jgi:hypothetical protein
VGRVLLAAALVTLIAVPAQAGDGLVRRASREAPFTVEVPADWRYRDATYPSDHSLERWADPHDAGARLQVEVSGCVGCVQPQSCVLNGTGCRPAPEQVVPARTISKRKLDRWTVRFVARTAGRKYPDRGLVAIAHRGNEIQGFAVVQLWLPAGQAKLANAILASFRLGPLH